MSWTFIQSTALSANATSVTFSNIPQTYKSLMILSSARTDRNTDLNDMILIRPNNSTTGLSSRRLYGASTSLASAIGATTAHVGVTCGATTTANVFSNSILCLLNYSSTTVNKVFSSEGVSENSSVIGLQEIDSALWSSTAAITSIVFVPETGPNFTTGSTFTLYGLA
jgi:hypothetical protein